ncbi:TlpA family protein disulfide reductase [Proteobacteria bacterium 005FR1]|nr:TlpA family protein disulfide reductase [Proteobacteria bacterium 005FR1]
MFNFVPAFFPAKARAFSLVIVSFLLVGLADLASAGETLELGDRAPDWMLSDSEGEPVSFYQHSDGQPAVVLFWATWCPNCAELMPRLEKLRKELASSDVRFYALNIWEDGDPVAHMENEGFDFTLLLNADSVAKRYRVRGTPGLFVMNRDKAITYVRAGNSSADEVYAAVKSALEKELR